MMLRLAVCASLLLSVSHSFGSILVEFDFSTAAGDQAATAPSWTAAGLTASDFHRGMGIEAYPGMGMINARGWALGEVESHQDYFEFAITPSSGVTLDLDAIAFGERRSAAGVHGLTLRSSLDGYVSNVAGLIEVPDDGETRDHVLALGSAFDAITSPVTFRLYGYLSETFSGRWGIANHSELGAFRVSGVATLPASEPSDAAGEMHAPEPSASFVWGIGAGICGIFGLRRLWRRPFQVA